eukprot:Colp12_sorted_trinity150504_noHs@34528
MHARMGLSIFTAVRAARCKTFATPSNAIFGNPISRKQSFRSLTTDVDPDRENVREAILESALKQVPEHGWSSLALAMGAKDRGLSVASAGILSKGPIELIDYFISKSNRRLSEEFEQGAKFAPEMSFEDKLRIAVKTRLQMNLPYMPHLAQSIAIMTAPQNVCHGVYNLASTVDAILYETGDRSIGLPWYTKRAALSAVYTSTELFMIQDKSFDYEDTWAFLDRRLQDAALVGGGVGKAAETLGQSGAVLQAAVTTAMNLTRMNDNRRW